MRLHRFYITTPISPPTFDIDDRDLVHQWRNVFRYNVGSQVILFDGSGMDYLCLITSIRNLGATISVVEEMEEIPKPKIALTLCVGLIKKDNFELVVQKLTELGVAKIVPVLCERSEKKNINMERLQKIAVEASEQSGRGDVPEILPIATLSDVLKNKTLPENKIYLNLEGEYIHDALRGDNSKEIAVFIGPEGGWSENETSLFANAGISPISLGTQVLRAETASIAISSLLLL